MILFVLEVLVNPIQTVFAGDRHWRSLDDVWNGFLDLDECQCPLGLIPHFYSRSLKLQQLVTPVSMPSRAYTSFLQKRTITFPSYLICVSMPSRAYTSFLPMMIICLNIGCMLCQCPLGLIPHFYLLQSTLVRIKLLVCVNALSGLYLISTVPLQKPRFYAVSRACFCRYLSEYSDNSRFSCMLTFWTYLMRCTYP